jgi:hypothetical protein
MWPARCLATSCTLLSMKLKAYKWLHLLANTHLAMYAPTRSFVQYTTRPPEEEAVQPQEFWENRLEMRMPAENTTINMSRKAGQTTHFHEILNLVLIQVKLSLDVHSRVLDRYQQRNDGISTVNYSQQGRDTVCHCIKCWSPSQNKDLTKRNKSSIEIPRLDERSTSRTRAWGLCVWTALVLDIPLRMPERMYTIRK